MYMERCLPLCRILTLFCGKLLQGQWDEGLKVDLRRHEECSWTRWRLPDNVKLDMYHLELYTTLQVQGASSAHMLASHCLL